MYSVHNEGKFVVAKRFIRTLKTNIYRYMNSIWKNGFIDKLDDIVNKYNNTYHRTIKIEPVDVKDNAYIDSMEFHSVEVIDNNSKFKVGDPVRISKYKNVFAKGCTLNWSEEVFVIKKCKNTVPLTYFINDLNCDKIIWAFCEKEPQKTNQQEFRIEKVIKKTGDKLHVKWKGYDSSFNNSIDQRPLV